MVCSRPTDQSPVVDEAAQVSASGVPRMSAVEQDWIRQAEAIDAVRRGIPHGPAVNTQSDAAGAVDGVKDGKYAFHTNQEPNPWWQVDLGQSEPLTRVVVYNRLDYAPGLHNADTLILLTSDDGRKWTKRYDNQGVHFGGITGAKPLEVTFPPGEVQARYVRLQIPSAQPIFLHLDEVEIYGAGRPREEPGTPETGQPEQRQHLVHVETASTAGRWPGPAANRRGPRTRPTPGCRLAEVRVRHDSLRARDRRRRSSAGTHFGTDDLR